MATHSSILAWKILWTEECVKEWDATEPAHTHTRTRTHTHTHSLYLLIPHS